MKKFLLIAALCAAGAALSAQAPGEARLLRFPAVHGDTIVFSYAGDLFSVPSSGGTARRLTTHEGYKSFARFSPDGKWLAFTGQYDGNTEVYLMPAEGGVPKRLTFTATLHRDDVSDRMGPNNIVMTWTPDGKGIVFRSRMHEANDFIGQLFKVGPDAGLPEQLPFTRGGFCSYSPDGTKFAYNRIFREFRTWKRYRGGMADDIWVYNFATGKSENITDNPAGDVYPMWSGSTIYFLSDRDEPKRMNLYAYDTKTRQTRKLTDFTDFDIKFPSLGDTAIVFENGGWIYRFDLKTEKTLKVPIFIHEDLAKGRGGIRSVAENVTNFEIAPDGKRALFGARGDVFTVPAKYGPTRNLTSTPGVHERNSKWSPDGKWISFVSDASGEDELYILPQDGSGPPQKLTDEKGPYLYQPYWSPDSTKLLWADKKLKLKIVDVKTKAVKEIASATSFEFSDYNWSPDSKWVAYARPEEKSPPRLYLYSLESGRTLEATDAWHASYAPAFSSDGKYLFFISDRDFSPTYSEIEYNFIYQDMARPYVLTLAKAGDSPFKPKSDEVEIAKEEAAGKPEGGKAGKPDDKKAGKTEGKDKDGKEEKKAVVVTVDEDGLADRIQALPVEPSNYRNLASAGDKLYYVRQGFREDKATLVLYDFKELKETPLGEVNGFELSADGKKMLVGKAGRYAILDIPAAPIEMKDTLDLSGMEVRLDRQAEWDQIYQECWRQMREFFYAPNMQGTNWAGVRAKYEPLLAHVIHRADLTYIIGEMIGELSAGHTYVGGGDMPKAARVPQGLLGAELAKDPASGYYRIKKILKGQNWDKTLRSPLTEVGVNVKEGEWILAVDGKSTRDMVNIYEALVNTVGKQVKLSINGTPDTKGARDVVVLPVGDEQALYYYQWVEGNIAKVAKATNGRVGYLHIPDMGEEGLNEFVKHFYPQLRKEALIVDVRGNGGGSVSPLILERLKRTADMIEMSRDAAPHWNPEAVLMGPMVCLLNEFSASDGDIFPYRFKHNHLGTLIGKRSWGGVVGIRGSLPLLDGGYLMKPEFAPYDMDGKGWIIEGHGVDPDIVVDNDPAREFLGFDDQLDKAISVIMDELKTKAKAIPPIPPFPDKH